MAKGYVCPCSQLRVVAFNRKCRIMCDKNRLDTFNAVRRTSWDRKLRQSRRGILHYAGLLIVGAFASERLEGAAEREVRFKGLTEKDSFDLNRRCEDIIEKAYKSGHEYERRHGGCCRCTVAALQDAINFVPRSKELFRAASCLDGGATPTGTQNCGSFTGAGMFIGWICGIEDFGNTGLSHELIHQVFQHFKEEYGGVLCKDVRNGVNGDCPEAVGRASKWTAEVLLRQFAKGESKQQAFTTPVHLKNHVLV